MLLNALPWLLLGCTLTIRYLLAQKRRLGWYLDLLTVPPWCLFYIRAEAWPLLALPFLFAVLDVKALRGRAWRVA